ncbi:MAG: TIGR04255 family protein [Saprospiraceae bacterium]
MSNLRYLKPSHGTHSIKEAVITIFLSAPIENPYSFQGLLNAEFKGRFDQFDEIETFKVAFPLSGLTSDHMVQENKNAGFRFSKMVDSNPIRILQGVNEDNRTFLSFHTLDYSRWRSFFEEYLACIQIIADKHQEFQIEAMSLQYIDEFIWEVANTLDLKVVFSDKSRHIPNSFLEHNSARLDLFFTNDKTKEDGTIYYDRINLTTSSTFENQTVITISHIVTHQLVNAINIKELLNQKVFQNMIEKAHRHTKETLKDLLTDETAALINLT